MITYNSITYNPVNFEKCRVCGAQLPPKMPRLFTVTLQDGREHVLTFRHIGCAVPGEEG